MASIASGSQRIPSQRVIEVRHVSGQDNRSSPRTRIDWEAGRADVKASTSEDDAPISGWRDRANYAKHWKTEFAEMEHLSDLGVMDFALYKAMQDWHNRVGDILAHVNDMLHPHGFEAIVKDDFGALRQMLQRARSPHASSRDADLGYEA
jgi:hypothetical protein